MSEDRQALDRASLRETSKEERNWAMGCHLAALAGFVVPFGNLLGPLVIWLLKRDEIELVDRNGKESINFQISITIYQLATLLVAILLMFVLVGILLIPVALGVAIFGVVMSIVAAVKTANGEDFEYPLCIRFLK